MKMNRDSSRTSELARRDEGDHSRCSPRPDNDNACDTVLGRQDITIHYASSGNMPTETLHSCGDPAASTLMDRKPSARSKEQVPCTGTSEPVRRVIRSQLFPGRSSEDHPQRPAYFSSQPSLESMSHRPRAWNRKQVELLPGCFASLVGSEETWHAFCEDNVITTECLSCQIFLYCKDTAGMVICPGCREISPVDGVGLGTEMLGLGLTVEAAFEMLKAYSVKEV
jgi:hypothetical protein